MALIELENVCYEYDEVTALKNISLQINKGECIGLEGDNGSGKTTLIKLLNGLIFPSEGNYLFDGKKICEKSMKNELFAKEFHQKVGYVFLNPEVLVLDEPMNGLDKKSREKFLTVILSLKAAGKTIIIAAHDENLLNVTSDRIIRISENHSLEL